MHGKALIVTLLISTSACAQDHRDFPQSQFDMTQSEPMRIGPNETVMEYWKRVEKVIEDNVRESILSQSLVVGAGDSGSGTMQSPTIACDNCIIQRSSGTYSITDSSVGVIIEPSNYWGSTTEAHQFDVSHKYDCSSDDHISDAVQLRVTHDLLDGFGISQIYMSYKLTDKQLGFMHYRARNGVVWALRNLHPQGLAECYASWLQYGISSAEKEDHLRKVGLGHTSDVEGNWDQAEIKMQSIPALPKSFPTKKKPTK